MRNRYEYFGQPVYNQFAEYQGPGYELLLREFNILILVTGNYRKMLLIFRWVKLLKPFSG